MFPDDPTGGYTNGLVPPWFAIRVKPKFERTSAQSLAARGFETFLPAYKKTQKWSDRIKISQFPLFPGYFFCRFGQTQRGAILITPGVIGVVQFGSELIPISDREIESVRLLTLQNIPTEPWPYLEQGEHVRISQGALAGVEGIVIEESNKCRLIVQITLLQRSVSLEIDRACIERTQSATEGGLRCLVSGSR